MSSRGLESSLRRQAQFAIACQSTIALRGRSTWSDAIDDFVQGKTWPVRHGQAAELTFALFALIDYRIDRDNVRMVEWPLDLWLLTSVQRYLQDDLFSPQREVVGQENTRNSPLTE